MTERAEQPLLLRPELPVIVGLLADCAAGALMLQGQFVVGLLIHLPAVLLWTEGIGRLTGRSLWRAVLARLRRERPGEAIATGSWPLGAAVIGLVLFPGLGTIGYSVALAITLRWSGSRLTPSGASVLDDVEEETDVRVAAPEAQPNLALEIQPLVDALRDPDKDVRRGAIARLARDPDAGSLRVLRGLLADGDPDIRNDAALILSRYQDSLSQSLAERTAYVRAQTLDPDGFVRLAERYRDAGLSGLFDEATSRRYLTDARATLRIATALQPRRADLWHALALAQHQTGDIIAARRSLDRWLEYAGDDADGYVLGMQIAYDAGDWTKLAALARRGQQVAGSGTESGELFAWWGEAAG